MGNDYKLGNNIGYNQVVNAENSELSYLGMDHIILNPGGSVRHEVLEEELVFILQKGDFKGKVECSNGPSLEGLKGSRSSVFDEGPTVIYAPPGSVIEIESKLGMEAMACTSPSKEVSQAIFFPPDKVTKVYRGALSWKRKLNIIFGPISESKKIIVGESISVPGGWIGFPPHKHSIHSENEYPLDEIYAFKVKGPHGGYGIHHTYDLEGKWDEHYTLDDNSVIVIPKGFHTSFAAPGCRLYMLWTLAGKEKTYKLVYDQRFTWLDDAEALF